MQRKLITCLSCHQYTGQYHRLVIANKCLLSRFNPASAEAGNAVPSTVVMFSVHFALADMGGLLELYHRCVADTG